MEKLTLEEAIAHAKEVAEKNYRDVDFESIDSINDDIKANCLKCAEEHEQLAEWLEELKSYKEVEKTGLLLRLPCKVGDDVYIIPSPSIYGLNIINGYEKHNKIYHHHVRTIIITDGYWYATSREEYGVYNEKVLNDIAYGITWFTDYEEAEKKLKEMKEECLSL